MVSEACGRGHHSDRLLCRLAARAGRRYECGRSGRLLCWLAARATATDLWQGRAAVRPYSPPN